jgi:ribonuclease HI
MEIQAVLDALRALPAEPLEVVSDSTYIVNCFRDRWWEGWQARGWLNSQRKPVANRDLWEPLIELYVARGKARGVTFRWVKGHSGDPMNDFVDRLAVEAAATQVGRHGFGNQGLPEPARRAAPGPALPPGHPIVVAGLRPPGLGGYDGGPIADAVRAQLLDILRAKHSLHPDALLLTGLGLGAEQLGAEAARTAGVPYVAVLPYPDPDSAWPAKSRAAFRVLLDGAAQAIVLQSKLPASRQAAGGALARRDAWLARHAAEAIVVWDEKDAAIGKLVRSLQDHLGEEEVWILNPAA